MDWKLRADPRAQEEAKDLLSESVALFERLGDAGRAAEGQTELAYCYWREGAFDEARVILGEVLRRLGEDDGERRAVAILRRAIVEASAKRYNDALHILTGAAPLFEARATDGIKGKFHNELANVLNYLSVAERRRDYTDLGACRVRSGWLPLRAGRAHRQSGGGGK